MIIEKQIYVSTTEPINNYGDSVPNWLNNFNKSNWWSGNDNLSFFSSKNGDCAYTQYGQNLSMWASARFYGEEVRIIEETVGDNNIINVKVGVRALFFNVLKTDYAKSIGYNVVYNVLINNTTVYNYAGSTIDEFSNSHSQEIIYNITVPPQETSTDSCLKITINYPNGEFTNQEIKLGFSLYNPLPKTYIPLKTFVNNQWRNVNDYAKNYYYINNVWSVIPDENVSTQNQENKGNIQYSSNGKNFFQNPKY